jgi:hypothetical protein
MVVEQMVEYHLDGLRAMDEVKVRPVEIMDHLDENHRLLDQMESIENQILFYFQKIFFSIKNINTTKYRRIGHVQLDPTEHFFFQNSFESTCVLSSYIESKSRLLFFLAKEKQQNKICMIKTQ